MGSIYPILLQNNLIPPKEERQDIINKFFNYKNPLIFHYNKLKESVELTEEDYKICQWETKNTYVQPTFVAETLKINKEEMEKIISHCKQNELSIQAYFSAAYLKASLELFENNLKEADVVNFQIIFEQRKYLKENKK